VNGPLRSPWRRVLVALCVPLLSLGCSLVGALAQESLVLEQPDVQRQLERLAPGYEAGGALGFTLRDTPVQERLYRRIAGPQRGLLWSAEFVSRWPTTEDQLDRWSAQAIGLLADALGREVRLAGWERLDAPAIGERRVAYRYALATGNGRLVGEATIVVFARGAHVGLAGTAAVQSRPPVDATELARLLDSPRTGS
jgi:hypothetical protein